MKTYKFPAGLRFCANLLFFSCTLAFVSSACGSAKPNVIFILTDDQGYGDLSAHGNPVLKTPKLDALREESVRFTDFHVAPMRAHYQQWVAGIRPIMGQKNYVDVGTLHEETTWLSSCNWTGSYADNWGNLARQNTPGHWNLQVETSGDYRVSMYMFHPEANVPLNGSLRGIRSRPATQARLLVDGNATTVPTAPDDTHVAFDIPLKKGQQVELEGHFLNKSGKVLSGTFYTFVQKVDQNSNTPSVIQYVSGTGVSGNTIHKQGKNP